MYYTLSVEFYDFHIKDWTKAYNMECHKLAHQTHYSIILMILKSKTKSTQQYI